MEHLNEFLKILETTADYREWFYTGSSVVCYPPITDTDTDIVVVYNGAFSSALQSAGFQVSPHDEYANDSLSACYRKGTLNIIACKGTEVFKKWRKATALAKMLNLQDKMQRVMLFQFMTEGRVRNTEIVY